MKITPKARLVSIIVAIVFMAGALIGTGTYLIVNHLNKSNALSSSYTNLGDIIDTSNKSSVNYDTYEKLMNRLGSRTGGATTLENGGDPIVFTMADRDWQVVYRDRQNSDIITVWMTEPYSTAVFASFWTSSTANQYTISDIYTTVNDYYDTQLSSYSVLSQIVVTPDDVGSSSYQSAQAQNGNYGGYTSMNGALNGTEHFWLPSLYEAFSFWGLDANDRGFDDTGVASSYWLRSGYSLDSSFAMLVGSAGSASYNYVYSSYGVRPAAHISLSALENAINYTITVESNNTAYGTVSGGGDFDRDDVNTTTITATPQNGYVFDRWEDSAGNKFYSNPYTFPVTKTETYTAYFREPQITITTANNGTEIALNQSEIFDIRYTYALDFTANNYILSATINSTIVQPITATNGSFIIDDACIAINYNTNRSGSRMYLEIIGVVDDITITLQFTNSAQTFTPASGGANIDGVALQVSASGTNTSLVAVGEARITGYSQTDGLTTVHVSAWASTGYRFIGWQVDGETISTLLSADIPYSDVEGKILVAVFEPISNANNINGTTDNGYTDDFA